MSRLGPALAGLGWSLGLAPVWATLLVLGTGLGVVWALGLLVTAPRRMKACLLACVLLWATPAWAVPITDPAAAACTDRGGAWWTFGGTGGTCLMPRTHFEARETFAPRETLTPRLDLPVELPVGGMPSFATAPPPLAPTPEPATLLLLGVTAAVGGFVARRRRGR